MKQVSTKSPYMSLALSQYGHLNTNLLKGNLKCCRTKAFMGVVFTLNNFTVSTILVIVVFVLTPHPLSNTGVAALSCTPCDFTKCESPEACPGGLTLDICGCCQVCARVKNERCGGPYGSLGRCDKGLHCFLHSVDGQPTTGNEEGICKDEVIQCNGDCPTAYLSSNCPPDSFLATSDQPHDDHSEMKHRNIHKTDTNDNSALINDANREMDDLSLLLGQTPHCLCNVSVCEMPECPHGHTTRLVRFGNGIPGTCCNLFVCRKPDSCQSVLCPTSMTESCPDDSVPGPSVWTTDGCCEIQQGCVCKKADQCEPTWCPLNYQLEMITRSTTLPGSCCDKFRCVIDNKPTNADSRCSSIEECNIICKHGLKQTFDGCFLCECREENCHLDCTFGLKTDVEGNTLCECKEPEINCPPWEEKKCGKKCEYGYKQTRDGCYRCKCRRCPQLMCTNRCVHGHMFNDEGCPLCTCREIIALELNNLNSKLEAIQGNHCLTWHGSLHENGQSWNDGCRMCYCHDGSEMCSLIACPIPHCSNPVFRTGDCCPTCPGHSELSTTRDNEMCQSSLGHHYIDKQTWNMDDCTKCICHKGAILCETPSCPPVVCNYPIKPKGQCCALCRGLNVAPKLNNFKHQCTSLTGVLYQHGEVWRSTPCQSCVCSNGQISCYNQMCPPINCHKVVQVKGHCCPTCAESSQPKFCTSSGLTFTNGEKWEGDNCSQCLCNNGHAECFPLTCPDLECAIFIKKPNQCCPECTDNTQLQSYIHRIQLFKDGIFSNRTALSKSGVSDSVIGIAVLTVLVFILAIVVFFLVLYLMTVKRDSNLKAIPMAVSPECHAQLTMNDKDTALAENRYFLQSLDYIADKERTERSANVYTDIAFVDQTKNSYPNKHILS